MRHATAVTLQHSFYAVGLLIGVVTILYFARVWLVPLALAVLLAFILTPVVGWLERRRLPRALAVPVAALAALALIVGIGFVVTLQLSSLVNELQEHGPKYQATLTGKLAPVFAFLASAQQVEDISKKGPASEHGPQPVPPTPVVVESRGIAALSWLPSVVWPALEVIATAVLVVILAIFVLARHESMRDRVLGLLGPRNVVSATRAMNDTTQRVSQYLFLLLCMNTGVGTVITVGLYLIGVPYALLCGLLATALRFIPYVGIWIAALLAFSLGATFFESWTAAVLVVALFLAVEALTANAIEPLVFGHGTGISPVPLLVAAVFWTWLWGAPGLLLSTPLTVCLMVLGRHVPGLRFFDTLLGNEPALDSATRYYQRLLAGDVKEASTILQCLLREQPLDGVGDEVILPALVRARLERDNDELSQDEERGVLRATRAILHTALAPDVEPETEPSFHVFAVPARGGVDALAMRLLAHLVRQAGGEVRFASYRRLPEAVRGAVQPVVVCVGALPPEEFLHAARALAHAHRALPTAKVVVGLWQQFDDTGKPAARLRSGGAVAVTTTLRDTVDQILTAVGKERPAVAEKAPAALPAGACP